VTHQFIRITTALAVLALAGRAAIISYQHAYELVTSQGETGFTVHLPPFAVDGLSWAANMVVLDASRRRPPCTTSAQVELGSWLVTTIGANLEMAWTKG
jgi:Protein of unknown function (DUF2637)